MGAKYEVRWSMNNACPFSHSKWTNSLSVALIAYIKAVLSGHTKVVLVMHDWIDCSNDCKDFEHCPAKVIGDE